MFKQQAGGSHCHVCMLSPSMNGLCGTSCSPDLVRQDLGLWPHPILSLGSEQCPWSVETQVSGNSLSHAESQDSAEEGSYIKGITHFGRPTVETFSKGAPFLPSCLWKSHLHGNLFPFKLGSPEPFNGDSSPPPLQSFKRLIHLLCYLWVSMCLDMGVCMCMEVLTEPWTTWLKLELEVVVHCPEWILGREVGCSARAASIITTKPSLQSLSTLFVFPFEM